MAINSKAKGSAGEREWSNFCKERGFNTRRSQQYCGANNDADVVGIEGLHMEVKRVEALNISKAMEQSTKEAKADEIPIVAHRKNREEWKVTLRADDFLKLYKVINDGKCESSI